MSGKLTKEQIREARLIALGIAPDVSVQPSPKNVASADNANPIGKQARTNLTRSITVGEFERCQQVMYKGGFATPEDMQRWYSQGFCYCSDPYFGLKQGNGGPCGILATVQAEILREMLFKDSNIEYSSLPLESEVNVGNLLAAAICNVLNRAAEGDNVQIIYISESSRDKPMPDWNLSDIAVTSYSSKDEATLALMEGSMQMLLQSGLGCLVVLISLLCSRGIDRVVADMDDASNTLIGQFGHCNQDLLNLLLTGRATSNVLDGEMALGDSGLRLRGVYQRNPIGYLTQLEALRYCEVGSYLKVPECPIWVVGSSSHFSVLFSLHRKVNEESCSQKLLSTLQRCFKAVDSAECGFIPASCLQEALEQINLHGDYAHSPIQAVLQSETDLARLRGHLQIDGEIILWSAFWVTISSLMTGKTLDDLISIPPESTGTDTGSVVPMGEANTRVRSDSEVARQLQAEIDGELYVPNSTPATNNSASNTNLASSISALNFSSLSSQFNIPALGGTSTESMGGSDAVKSGGIAATSAMDVDAPVAAGSAGWEAPVLQRSDSELARELQAQWDAEDRGAGGDYFQDFGSDPFDSTSAGAAVTRQQHSSSMDVNPGRPDDYLDDLPELLPAASTTIAGADTDTAQGHRASGVATGNMFKVPAENNTFSAIAHTRTATGSSADLESFTMHHFNGLESAGRSARLTTFDLLIRTSMDSVGIAIAFGSGEHTNTGGAFNCPAEEVLRTRWPGCRVDWRGQPPPSID